jgi:1-acyl-sn-glycerol-3-phosphate acyltransferase
MIVKLWARFHLWTTGATIKITGRENLPKSENVAFVSNHQSNNDIPLLLGYTNRLVGFLAKKELKKVLFFSQWMQLIGCVFIDRKSVRSSINSFNETIETIKNSHSMIIFPEGTRSQSNKINKFNEGILRLLISNNITIVPCTIINTCQTFEANKRIRSANIELIFHSPYRTSTIAEDEVKTKIQDLRSIINEPLLKYQEQL